MTNIVLVGGSFLGAWAWQRVTPRLRAAGHDVHPLTLTGFGDRAHLGTPETDLSTHVQDIVAAIETVDLTDVVLVGHSYGGAPATAAARRIHDRLRALVYVAGVLPRDGETLFETAGPQVTAAIMAAVTARGGGWSIPVLTDEELGLFFGAHELAGEDLRWFRRYATPQPLGTYTERVRLPDPATLPTAYLSCRGDGPAPALPAGWRHAELPTGHWPMITLPDQLADHLDAYARSL
ncbi:MAG: alpha/beta fold hydrolase [Mycobacteriales bacterium]